jgi:hypothetical protein
MNPYSFACETTFLKISSCFAIVVQKYKKLPCSDEDCCVFYIFIF